MPIHKQGELEVFNNVQILALSHFLGGSLQSQ